MNMLHYILAEDRKTPVVVPMLVWARWFSQRDRILAQHVVGEHITVSTVFLGIDHRFSGEGPPILWESMAFDKRIHPELGWGESISMYRYSSHEEAMAGHMAMLKHYREKEIIKETEHDHRSDGTSS